MAPVLKLIAGERHSPWEFNFKRVYLLERFQANGPKKQLIGIDSCSRCKHLISKTVTLKKSQDSELTFKICDFA